VLDRWREELRSLVETESNRECRIRVDAYLDTGYGSCYLRDEHIAAIVQNALFHHDGERYFLHAWCVMPNHVHTLFTSHEDWKLNQIAHSWKSFTANECNRALERKGEFWQRESHDRYIRSEQHFSNTVRYIEDNPVKAGLCLTAEDWTWSSAWFRREAGSRDA
jgi:putative DNA methylase